MKYLICSDIHGSIDSVNILLKKFYAFDCDKILCLGDVLYHGPRNDLPPHYAPKEVIAALNPLKDKILCIKGNCEAEVDEMVLDFSILNSYDGVMNDISVHLEHGHHLDAYCGNAKLVLYGHTHIPLCQEMGGIQYINPGSITIPKAGSKRGYAVWDNHIIIGYDIEDHEVFRYAYEIA